jgi:outer membrane protein TolC
MAEPSRLSKRFAAWSLPAWMFLGTALLGVLIAETRGQIPEEPIPQHQLTLADCVAIGLARQPTIVAHRASLAAAETQVQALGNMHLAGLISREMPIRKEQAAQGVTIAAAGLDQAQRETVYAVTRNYFSVIYATKQEAVVSGLLNKLKAAQEKAALLAKAGNPDFVVTDVDVDRLAANIDLFQLRQIEAAVGLKRAAAALREAMGVDPHTRVLLVRTELPPAEEIPGRDGLIALALARRGEMIQATTALCVTQLEVQAQQTGCLRPMKQTFASVADVHVRPIPEGVSNTEYRPGAIGLEMPPTLVGKRADRVQRAEDLSARAAAVVDKTRNLITLETEEAYYKWEDAVRKLRTLAQTRERALRVAKSVQARFDIGKVAGEELIHAQTLPDQAQAAYNEALYNHALALAALERITAGGFMPAFRAAGASALPRKSE